MRTFQFFAISPSSQRNWTTTSRRMNLARTTASPLSFLLASSSTIRAISGLSTNIKLNDPTLLRVPDTDSKRKTFEVYNPAATSDQVDNGSAVIALLESKTGADARKAIESSSVAFKNWSQKTTGMERSRFLSRWSDLIKENSEDITKIMSLESGKPLAESTAELNYGTSFIDFYAGEALRPTNAGGGAIWPSPFSLADGSPKGKIMAVQEAVGVCALITPWNFPLAMITRKASPALAAGCTVVLKPSELTPLTAVALYQLALRAGLPKNVFELVISDTESTPDVGEEMCKNTIVKKVSFTGSTRVGKLLMKMSSDTVKRVSLELGGNAPFIVFGDADIEQSVKAAMASKFRNAGQTCVSADRFLVHESVEEEFTMAICKEVESLKVGSGMEADNTMGPLISKAAVENVKEKVDEAVSDGAECLIGGGLLPGLGPNFYQPTVLRDVKTSSRIWATETFGPVIPLRSFRSEEEAIELANDTTAGLASYICTNDMSRAFRVSSRLEYGMVGINEGAISNALAPFGGVKESGLGREGSSAGLSEFVETKYIMLNH